MVVSHNKGSLGGREMMVVTIDEGSRDDVMWGHS